MMPTTVQKRLSDMARIGESLAWSSRPEGISQTTVDLLTEVFGCACTFIHLLDSSGDYFVRYETHSEIPEIVLREPRVSRSTGRMRQMLTEHQPIIMDFLYPDPADSIPEVSYKYRSAASFPILVGTEMLGMFSVVYKDSYSWTPDEIDYMIDLGRLLGVSVQHAQIARKMADLEILLERKRLSGELHDHLSQLISSLNMRTAAALLSMEEGDSDRLQHDLEKIQHTGQEAARMLREEMLSLRTASNETRSLIPGLRQCILRFSQQWGIEADLVLEDDLENLIVSTQVELQFIRILHESLSNVLRHATASKVRVTLHCDDNKLRMQICDNGSGFDLENVSNERLGLRIMRERAETLGGELSITSGNGSGTTVQVDVPRYT